MITGGSLLYTPPNGSRMYSSGLAVVGDCWDDTALCIGCQSVVEYDDTWDGLAAGSSGVGKISLFDATGFRSRIAAECDFDPIAAGLCQ